MRYLRQNTAVIVTVGPFYDKTDGVTIEGALTIANERISLVVDHDDGSAPTIVLDNIPGATSGTDNDLNYISGNDAGLMQLELTQANTNYTGRAFLSITDAANHVPVFHEFMILPAATFDALFGSGALDANVVNWKGSAAPDMTGDAFARLGAPAGASVSADIAAVKTDTAAVLVDTAAIKTDTAAILNDTGTSGVLLATDALSAAALKTDAVTEIVDAIKAAVIETEGSYTIQQALSILLSALAGVTTNGGATLKSPNGVATRITATINSSSERTAMTLTPST